MECMAIQPQYQWITEANRIDIDHIIPLKYAFEMGASDWRKSKKEKFANDFVKAWVKVMDSDRFDKMN